MELDERALRRLHRPSWVAITAVSIHAVWLIGVVYLAFAAPNIRPFEYFGNLLVQDCPGCSRVANAVAAAGEMGRLDFVALCLAILGTSVAVLAFGGFFLMRKSVIDAASAEARIMLPNLVEQLLQKDEGDIIYRALLKSPGAMSSAIKQSKLDIEKELSDTETEKLTEAMAKGVADA